MTGDPRIQLEDQNCVRGDPHTYTITIVNADGSPKNLTSYGSSWSAMLRGDPSFTTSTSWMVDATNAATGVLVLSLTGATTAAMPSHRDSNALNADQFDSFTYDVQASGGSPSPQTLFVGAFFLWKEYTHG